MPVTTLDSTREEVAHLWPRFLPDGRHFLYLSQTRQRDRWAVYAASIDSAERKLILQTEFMAEFAPPDRLLFLRGDTLFAQTLDLGRLELSGEPVLVAQPVTGTAAGRVGVSVSNTGVLVHSGRAGAGSRTLVWVDRHGREEPIPVPPRMYLSPRLSPDGTRIVVSTNDEEYDLWVWDLRAATLARMTFEPGGDSNPLWTPDGRRLVFSSAQAGGAANLYIQAASGTQAATRLTNSVNSQTPSAITSNGTQVVFFENAGNNQRDLRLLALDSASPSSQFSPTGEGSGFTVSSLLATRFDERGGTVSPNGRWLAYESNSSGQYEVYVRPFPNADDGVWQISNGGGMQARWAKNGEELFYLAPDGALMAVRVATGAVADREWSTRMPTKVLERGYYTGNVSAANAQYDISPDAQRFLMVKLAEGIDLAGSRSLVVILNWPQVLTAPVPTNR